MASRKIKTSSGDLLVSPGYWWARKKVSGDFIIVEVWMDCQSANYMGTPEIDDVENDIYELVTPVTRP
jgi:hypothetical protein